MSNDIDDIEASLRAAEGIIKNAWLFWLIGGAISTIVGMWLLLNPRMTVGILVVLFGIGLIVNGISDLAMAGDHPIPALSYVVSILFVIAGIILIFNRSTGASTLALIVGLSILITGVGDVVVAFMARDEVEHWLLVAFLGACGIVVGVMSLSWPKATLFVLAILVGVRLLVSGLVHMGIGLRLRDVTAG